MHLSRRKCLKIVIIAAALVFVIISGAAFFKSKNTSSIKQPQYFLGNTSGNIINNGLMAYQEGYIYFSNTSDKNKLYRMKEDGSDKKKLSDDSCSFINVIEEWVYYRNASDGGKIYKIKTDGTMKQNNDGVTVVRSIYDLNNALLGNISYEIKEDKLTKAFEKAKEIVKELIKPEMTDLEKELILHNYVVTHSKYDIDNYKKDKITVDEGSAYGILVKGIGVCSGYAESLQLLLNLSNVECRWVVGMAGQPGNTGLHAWNIVKIDGEYYHLDATWDDPVPDMGNHLTVS